MEFSQVQPIGKKNSDPFLQLFCFDLCFFLSILFSLISDIDPLIARELRKVTLKKRKAKGAHITRKPSRVQAMVAFEPKIIIFDASEIASLIMAKLFQLSKERVSFSASRAITFEGVLGDQALGFEICAFDNWKVAKCLFKEFISPIDAN